ncbi:MAG: hypothetical protein ACPGH0_02995 [Opitutales bacterium]
MQTGEWQSRVALESIGFATLGSVWGRFVFPAAPHPHWDCGLMLPVNPNKGDKWKK